jgi:hypothetical protein
LIALRSTISQSYLLIWCENYYLSDIVLCIKYRIVYLNSYLSTYFNFAYKLAYTMTME